MHHTAAAAKTQPFQPQARRAGVVLAAAALALTMMGGCAAMPGSARADAASKTPRLSYFHRLQDRVDQWREALPAVRRSADAAAARVIDGGAMYFAGPQKSLIHEAWGRSGGPMFGVGLKGDQALHKGDTVLAGALGTPQSDQALAALARRTAAAHAHLVIFGKTSMQAPEEIDRLPAKPFASARDQNQGQSQGRAPITSVSNVVGLWAWMGEFVHGCVSRGKMPHMYESYGMPGGKDRGKLYHNKAGHFHRLCAVKPEAAAKLAGRYLDAVQEALTRTAAQGRTFERAAKVLRAAHARGKEVQVTGDSHMFPYEPRLPATPTWFKVTKREKVQPGGIVLDLGYQGFPWQMADKVREAGGTAIVTSSHPPPAWFKQADKGIYINPHWAIADAAVSLRGYDIPLLPTSGVMQWSIYWQLVQLAGP